MTAMRDYLAHQARVTGIIFAPDSEWVLSIGRDKLFQLHSSETGQKLGSYQTDAWYTALQYPFAKFYIFTNKRFLQCRKMKQYISIIVTHLYEKLNSHAYIDLTPNPNMLS